MEKALGKTSKAASRRPSSSYLKTLQIPKQSEIPPVKWPDLSTKTPSEIANLLALRTIYTDLPRTANQKRASKKREWKVFVFPTDIREWNGCTIARFYPMYLPLNLIEMLSLSTDELVANLPIKAKKKKRGSELTYHLGNWTRSRKTPGLTAQTENFVAAWKWLKINKPLFEFISYLFYQYNQPLWTRYQKVIMDNNLEPLVAVWATVAININFASSVHFDQLDRLGGLCWVVAFGEFDSGELIFPDLKMCFPMGTGCILAFNSTEVCHYVQQFIGKRNSIVLFTHDEMFTK